MKKVLRGYAPTVVGLLLSSAVLAEPVPIVNPSFELDVLPPGGIRIGIEGWLTSSGGGDGVFHPTDMQYPGGGLVPDGENVAYANEPGNQVSQVLSAPLEPNMLYRLDVQVGNRLDESYVGYRLEIRAGGVGLAEVESMVVPDPGTFVNASLSYSSSADDPQLGQAIEIRIRSTGTQANFDQVTLDRTPTLPPTPEIPTLRPLGLLIVGVLLLIAAFRRLGSS